ncbi:bifunctional hydroxymethylpyrimidine kinase/phosphomethylpyrimidine kinase [Parvularcula flava]|uniref:hydroxymethylpyrimidine kinase n=1 Tax=Aquisalinus luteolus TaxID=1566827 RepID=A0A8J3ERX5_9PROT|nr:bifunctional hydroxymethylpyrimidine kinase/phosphomethylpyrimidine kinase [Aquisalinus luteolus]NHK29312.1 bifunctional hydroxymethylpyrimidine kinase/phosphomethylpyrimidine kinase [Aquisalinus luteolus]GGI01161.1 hydroxymethylpyrimidine/phosphomethylpyrimidine kinase [Aquisalinus luteolus]
MKGRVLIIAGSDPSGGAGIQADIKAVTALGAYAATAITAVTVQNTQGVTGIHPIPGDIIKGQIDAVLSDIGADVIKIGMIGSVATAEIIEETLKANPGIPAVLDPVLVATSGDSLGDSDVATFIQDRLLPLTALVTPNMPEAEVLTGLTVTGEATQKLAGQSLVGAGAKAALVKGGHGGGQTVTDVLCTSDHPPRSFLKPRIRSTNTHGTGCTLASAIAAGMAQGLDIDHAVTQALDYVWKAIKTAPGLGSGNGPLNHAHSLDKG